MWKIHGTPQTTGTSLLNTTYLYLLSHWWCHAGYLMMQSLFHPSHLFQLLPVNQVILVTCVLKKLMASIHVPNLHWRQINYLWMLWKPCYVWSIKILSVRGTGNDSLPSLQWPQSLWIESVSKRNLPSYKNLVLTSQTYNTIIYNKWSRQVIIALESIGGSDLALSLSSVTGLPDCSRNYCIEPNHIRYNTISADKLYITPISLS